MNEAMKTIENLLELVYSEIKRVKNDPNLSDKSYALLREAANDALDLKRKVGDARGWNTK